MRFKNILVSGPHRAGTRFISKCFAWHSGTLWVPEDRIRSPRLMMTLLNDIGPVTLQCPHLAFTLGEFRWSDLLIVMVRRDKDKIYASRAEARMPDGSLVDLSYQELDMIKGYGVEICDDPVQLVYDRWEEQKKHIPAWMEVNYSDFEGHPLWVDESARRQRPDWHVMTTQ
jgi:hypothetical protein